MRVDGRIAFYDEKDYYAMKYPEALITKYKVKADKKMKFTKENVDKLFSEHDKYICFSFNDLRGEILKLDDTPEKVVVPKVVAEWIEGNKEMEVSLQTLLKCYANLYRGELDIFSSEWLKALQWYVENPYKFIRAYEEGYTTTSL